MLKITRQNEPIEVKQIVVTLYGVPGLGKSTLGFSAESPILLDFDQGAYRAANRKDSVQVESWDDVDSITAEDLAPYKTVVVDTAGRALDFLTADIIKKDPKKSMGGGALTLQGFGVLKARFTAWLKGLKVLGKDVVLIAHSSEEHKGDEILERIDVQGGSKGEIYKSADCMGRLYLVNQKRTLSFSPTDTAFGKNPANLEPLAVPHPANEPDFLGGVIRQIKEKLNTMTEEQAKRQEEIERWVNRFSELETPEQFNKMAAMVKEAPSEILPVLRGAFRKQVENAGVVFDKEQGAYVYKEAA